MEVPESWAGDHAIDTAFVNCHATRSSMLFSEAVVLSFPCFYHASHVFL